MKTKVTSLAIFLVCVFSFQLAFAEEKVTIHQNTQDWTFGFFSLFETAPPDGVELIVTNQALTITTAKSAPKPFPMLINFKTNDLV